MLTLLIGVAVLVLVLFAARAFADADPARLSKQLRVAGGVAALGAAGYLTLTGRFYVALPLGFLAFSLFDWWRMPAGFGARTQRSSNQTSRVRSAFVEMELDHDTGAMRGRILAGQYEGVPLETLDRATLVSLLAGLYNTAPFSATIRSNSFSASGKTASNSGSSLPVAIINLRPDLRKASRAATVSADTRLSAAMVPS